MIKINLKSKVSTYIIESYDELQASSYKAVVIKYMPDFVIKRTFSYSLTIKRSDSVIEFVGVYNMKVTKEDYESFISD